MIIKESDNKFKKHFSFYKNLKKRRIRLALMILFLLALYSSILFIAGAIADKKGFAGSIKLVVLSNYQIPLNYLKGLTAGPVERISIDIKFKNFQQLQYEREIALSKNKLISNKYVPATIQYNNKTYKVKLRLKGDHTDHLAGNKWSFRIKVKGDNAILGMKQFSIHHPKTRNYIYEWIFHQILKREDIISLRYDFIDVVLNGKNFGIYALEEHFEKRLIEHNQRKEGPIIRFNENLMWDEALQIGSPYPNAKSSGYGSYLSSNIDAFHTNKILNDTIMFNNYSKGISLLESFRNGELSTKDVFDIEKLSSFFAITDIMGAEHGSRWHNTRFYYNPITSRLEPIGFDGNSGQHRSSLFATIDNYMERGDITPYKSYYSMIFKDKLFYYNYISKLVKYSKKSYLDSIFVDVNYELEKKLDILYKEWPYFYFDKGILYKNQSYIREILNPKKAMHSYLINKNENQIELAFGNIQSLPVNVLSVTINDSVNIFPKKEIVLPCKLSSEPVEYHNYYFTIPKDIELTDNSFNTLKVNHKIYGTSKLKTIEVFPWNYLDENLIDDDFIRKPSNISDFDFIYIDKEHKLINFKPGIWKVTQNIHIPKGYKVFLNEDTKLNLINFASIISYSPLNFLGSDENPIVITSSDSTGQGIFVLNTKEKSVLDHVQFKNLSSPSKNGWELSGAVTFYEADVSINNCIFSNNRRGDDFLNIVRAAFNINNTLFNDILSDAFDSDFCKGNISNSSFINCGNDAIDISGTNLKINNIFIDNIGDKGLSAGENSQLIANNIKIANSEIAVCSKDMSEIIVSDVSLENDKIGFTAFQKKSEFGPGNIEGSKVKMTNIPIPYLIEAQSICTIDGEIKESINNNKVKDVLYRTTYGKSSK